MLTSLGVFAVVMDLFGMVPAVFAVVTISALGDRTARLWSTLALDVADPDNALPAALRAQLFYLFEFTEVHSRRLLGRDGASPDILVEINTAVLRGLRGEGGTA